MKSKTNQKQSNKKIKGSKRKTFGTRLSLWGGILAIVSAIAYFVVYKGTAGNQIDRVFSEVNCGLMLGGGILALLMELFRFKFGRILPVACYSVAVASHYVESAYPLADALTGVNFLGGNLTLAIVFAVLFTLSTLMAIVASFTD